jgi:AraC-like DNA-binding protein
MTLAEPTVAAGLARGLIEFAARKGAAAGELVERSGIEPREVDDQDGRVPMGKYVALMRAAKAMTGDPALALHYGNEVDMAELSVVGLLVHASETFGEVLAQLNRYGRLLVEVDTGGADRFQLERVAGKLWIVDARPDADDFPELTEATFARFVGRTRQFGMPGFVTEVHVTHAAPPHADEYERVFGAPTRFRSGRNAMRIDESWLSHRVQRQPRYVFGILGGHAERLLRELEGSKSVRGRVEALLMPILHTGETGMARIAAGMGWSGDTLYRKLKAEGVTFEEVLDELRHKLATQYLSGRKVSVNEAAYLVGFSDPSAFSRAFKRWTGISPKAMRGDP